MMMSKYLIEFQLQYSSAFGSAIVGDVEYRIYNNYEQD